MAGTDGFETKRSGEVPGRPAGNKTAGPERSKLLVQAAEPNLGNPRRRPDKRSLRRKELKGRAGPAAEETARDRENGAAAETDRRGLQRRAAAERNNPQTAKPIDREPRELTAAQRRPGEGAKERRNATTHRLRTRELTAAQQRPGKRTERRRTEQHRPCEKNEASCEREDDAIMEYYNNILCIPTRELLEVMSESNYKQLAARGKLEVARRACRGRCALVVFDSLPDKYRAAARERYPQGGIMQLQKWFRDNYTLDAEARSFFSRFRFDNGDPLPSDKIAEYTVNASVIGAVRRLMANARALRQAQLDGQIGRASCRERV